MIIPRYGDSSDACRHGATSPSQKMRRHFPTDRPGLLPSDEHAEKPLTIPKGICILHSGAAPQGRYHWRSCVSTIRSREFDASPRVILLDVDSLLRNFGTISTRLSRISLARTTLHADRRIATNTTATARIATQAHATVVKVEGITHRARHRVSSANFG